jgi:hypothetical protein
MTSWPGGLFLMIAKFCILRRLFVRTFGGLAITSLIVTGLTSGPGFGQDTPPAKLKPFEGPPPVDLLLPRREPLGVGEPDTVPGWMRPPDAHYRIWCGKGEPSCGNALGFGGNWIYRTVRRCWQPPMPAKITTSVWFGTNANLPKQDIHGTILLRFGLNRNGTLVGPPQLIKPNPPSVTRAEVDELIAAIERCQPYDALPDSKYDQWRDVLMGVLIERPPQAPNAPTRAPREKRLTAPSFDGRADAAPPARIAAGD